MNARARLPQKLAVLSRTELETIIHECAFNREDDLIARRYMVEKQCQIDIATEIGYERSPIGRRLPRIMNRAIEIMERIS